MRTIIAIGLAVILAGCAADAAKLPVPGARPNATASPAAPTAAQPPAPTAAQLAEARAASQAATCSWIKAAGIPDVKPHLIDTSRTKRAIAEMQAAARVTCPELAAKPAADPAPTKTKAEPAKTAVVKPLPSEMPTPIAFPSRPSINVPMPGQGGGASGLEAVKR
ncbi:MAG: hypothetical protein AB7O57_04645 [Hyphomicrobiaceae bacterium]